MKKASLVAMAGQMDGKNLYAIHDEHGYTVMLLWETLERITKNHVLI